MAEKKGAYVLGSSESDSPGGYPMVNMSGSYPMGGYPPSSPTPGYPGVVNMQPGVMQAWQQPTGNFKWGIKIFISIILAP